MRIQHSKKSQRYVAIFDWVEPIEVGIFQTDSHQHIQCVDCFTLSFCVDPSKGWTLEQTKALALELEKRGEKETPILLEAQASKTLHRLLSLPQVNRTQIKKIVTFEAAHALPWSLDQLAWDYQILKGSDGRHFAWIAANAKEAMNATLCHFKAAGLSVGSVQPRAATLLNLLARQLGGSLPSDIVFIDVDLHGASLLILQSGLIFCRYVSIDWSHPSERCCEELLRQIDQTHSFFMQQIQTHTEKQKPETIWMHASSLHVKETVQHLKSLLPGVVKEFKAPACMEASTVSPSGGSTMQGALHLEALVSSELKNRVVFLNLTSSFKKSALRAFKPSPAQRKAALVLILLIFTLWIGFDGYRIHSLKTETAVLQEKTRLQREHLKLTEPLEISRYRKNEFVDLCAKLKTALPEGAKLASMHCNWNDDAPTLIQNITSPWLKSDALAVEARGYLPLLQPTDSHVSWSVQTDRARLNLQQTHQKLRTTLNDLKDMKLEPASWDADPLLLAFTFQAGSFHPAE